MMHDKGFARWLAEFVSGFGNGLQVGQCNMVLGQGMSGARNLAALHRVEEASFPNY